VPQVDAGDPVDWGITVAPERAGPGDLGGRIRDAGGADRQEHVARGGGFDRCGQRRPRERLTELHHTRADACRTALMTTGSSLDG
jgi:hypothetical protein